MLDPSKQDAGMRAMSTGGTPAARPFTFDGGTLPDNVCSLNVGATCDGAEDCQHGQVCCGDFDPVFATYLRIRCQTTCDRQDQFEFCHAGEACPADLVCRRSLIVPFDFMMVCAPPTPLAPIDNSSERIVDEIACGGATCDARSEQCCLRARIQGMSPPVGLTPYCTRRGESCDCEDAPASHNPPDAGADPADDSDGGSSPSRRG